MPAPTPEEMVLRGWNAETFRYHQNLRRSLQAVAVSAASMTERLDKGDERMADEARRMAAHAVDVAQHAAALQASYELNFALPESKAPER